MKFKFCFQISLNGALTNGSGGGSHSHHQPEAVQIRDRKEISHLVNHCSKLSMKKAVSK
jgi:hypothetical protein